MELGYSAALGVLLASLLTGAVIPTSPKVKPGRWMTRAVDAEASLPGLLSITAPGYYWCMGGAQVAVLGDCVWSGVLGLMVGDCKQRLWQVRIRLWSRFASECFMSPGWAVRQVSQEEGFREAPAQLLRLRLLHASRERRPRGHDASAGEAGRGPLLKVPLWLPGSPSV